MCYGTTTSVVFLRTSIVSVQAIDPKGLYPNRFCPLDYSLHCIAHYNVLAQGTQPHYE